MTYHSRLAIAAFMGLLLASIATADSSNAGFRVIDSERGITVSVRDEPGQELPTFRGQGVIEGNVLYVLSVVLDAEGAMEWAEGADEVALLREIDARSHLIYSHTDTPWPVTDRDMIFKRKIEIVRPGTEFRLDLSCVREGKAEREGIIRVTDCSSTFVLRKIDETHTEIDYQVHIDPGGSLPKWLIAWASRKVPFDTLINLEGHVKKTRAKYAGSARSWASAR